MLVFFTVREYTKRAFGSRSAQMIKAKKRLSEIFRKASESRNFIKVHTLYKGTKQLAVLGLGELRNMRLKAKEKLFPPSLEDMALKRELEKPYFNFDILCLDKNSLDFLEKSRNTLLAHRIFSIEGLNSGETEEFIYINCIADALLIGEAESPLSDFLREVYGFRFLNLKRAKELLTEGKAPSKLFSEVYPKVSIIVLSYNQRKLTRECIESVLFSSAYENIELIVVDNASADGSAEMLLALEKEHANLNPILNSANRGFAGGNNDGIRAAKGEYVLLLNNDTLVTRGYITTMLKYFDKIPNLGMAGACTNNIGNEAKVKVSYYDKGGMPLFAHKFARERRSKYREQSEGTLAMFCVLIKSAVFEETGLLDERYERGMFEDDDFAMSLRQAGKSLIIAEDAFVHHYGSQTFNAMKNRQYMQLFYENKRRFEEKWGTTWQLHSKRRK